jgi:hypothetical protein
VLIFPDMIRYRSVLSFCFAIFDSVVQVFVFFVSVDCYQLLSVVLIMQEIDSF